MSINSNSGGQLLSILGVLESHHKAYPQMQTQDVYKLIYQAAMGMRHLFYMGGAKNYFIKEYSEIEARNDIALFELIHPEKKIFRMNLRKAKATAIGQEFLWEQMVESALEILPNENLLKYWWPEYIESSLSKKIPGYQEFEAKLLKTGFKAYHHSNTYRQAYQPSYRLITDNIAKRILRKT